MFYQTPAPPSAIVPKAAGVILVVKPIVATITPVPVARAKVCAPSAPSKLPSAPMVTLAGLQTVATTVQFTEYV